MAATLMVDQHDVGCSAVASPFCTISEAVDAAFAGDEIVVEAGNYVENITIDVPVVLVSTGGRSVTIIEGISGAGSLGTIVISPNVDGVQIGDVDQGFTIVGIDNGNPGIENAAVYFQGNHAGAGVFGNEIIANGDHGLLTEFGVTITDFEIRENKFAGTTFFPPPATAQPVYGAERSASVSCHGRRRWRRQHVRHHLQRQPDHRNLWRRELGWRPARQPPGDDGRGWRCHPRQCFPRNDPGFGTSLRARGPDTDIARNTFDDAGLSDSPCYIFVQEVGDTLGKIRGRNTFVDRQAIVDPAPNETTGAICPRD